MELTVEQQQAIEEGQTVETTVNGIPCVLVRKEIFDQVKRIVGYDDGDLTHDEMRALLAKSSDGNGWNEPEMDDYDRYDELKP